MGMRGAHPVSPAAVHGHALGGERASLLPRPRSALTVTPLDVIGWCVAITFSILVALVLGSLIAGVIGALRHPRPVPAPKPVAPPARPKHIVDEPYWMAAQLAFVGSMTGMTVEQVRDMPVDEYLSLLVQITEAAKKSAGT